MATENSLFEIRQLTGPKRTLQLGGRGLPFAESMEFGGSQRLERTLYGGSPDASIQIQGPDEKPWSPNGLWSDRYMVGPDPSLVARITSGPGATGTQMQTAYEIAQALDLMRREGQIVRVSYDLEVRYGVIDDFTYKFAPTSDRIEWALSFQWLGRTDSPALPSATQRIGALDYSSKLSQAVATLQGLVTDVSELPTQFPLEFDVLSSFQAGVAALSNLRDSAYNTIASYTSQIQSATETARSVLTLGAQTITDSVDLALETEHTSYRVLTGIADQAGVTAGQYVAAAAYANRLRDQAVVIQDFSQDFVDTAREAYTSDVLAIYTVKTGEDLRSISLAFYGTANDWQAIASFNGLRGPVDVLPGDGLFIPRITA